MHARMELYYTLYIKNSLLLLVIATIMLNETISIKCSINKSKNNLSKYIFNKY